jgi:hypothetical protein
MVSFSILLTYILIQWSNANLDTGYHEPIRSGDSDYGNIYETKTINEIDFKFSLKENCILVKGCFMVRTKPACPQFITYNFEDKKRYTKTLTTFEKGQEGDDWYEIKFFLEKYLFAKVRSVWIYSRDEINHRVNFKLKSYEININSLNLVDSSNGYFEFLPMKNGFTKINYLLDYRIKPTKLKKYLYRIQRDESITILSDYKEYLEENCHDKNGFGH